MTGEAEDNHPQPRHIELVTDEAVEAKNGDGGSGSSPVLTNGKGWDGKLRVPGKVALANPEALSDPEYSDEENVVEGEQIQADEGVPYRVLFGHLSSPLCACVDSAQRNKAGIHELTCDNYQTSLRKKTQTQTSSSPSTHAYSPSPSSTSSASRRSRVCVYARTALLELKASRPLPRRWSTSTSTTTLLAISGG